MIDLYGPDVQASRARSPTTACWPDGWRNGACDLLQLFQRGWDHHDKLAKDLPKFCRATDQAAAALITDLKQRGLLDETLVVWGGEFGRTVYCQGKLTHSDYGRDHHPRCFTMWMAGGGFQPGITYGATDDFSYNIVDRPVHVHDLHATMLHCLGIDHTRLTFKHQGRRHRLTDVAGNVVHALLAPDAKDRTMQCFAHLCCAIGLMFAVPGLLLAVDVERRGNDFIVSIEGQEFARFDRGRQRSRPCIRAVRAADGTLLSRPISPAGGDHPHHTGLWIAVDKVNGIAFWHEQGKINNLSVDVVESGEL